MPIAVLSCLPGAHSGLRTASPLGRLRACLCPNESCLTIQSPSWRGSRAAIIPSLWQVFQPDFPWPVPERGARIKEEGGQPRRETLPRTRHIMTQRSDLTHTSMWVFQSPPPTPVRKLALFFRLAVVLNSLASHRAPLKTHLHTECEWGRDFCTHATPCMEMLGPLKVGVACWVGNRPLGHGALKEEAGRENPLFIPFGWFLPFDWVGWVVSGHGSAPHLASSSYSADQLAAQGGSGGWG